MYITFNDESFLENLKLLDSQSSRRGRNFIAACYSLDRKSKDEQIRLFFEFQKSMYDDSLSEENIIEMFKASKSTYYRALKNFEAGKTSTLSPKKGAPQKFFPELYPELLQWIEKNVKKGYPPTRAETTQKVQQIISAHGLKQELSRFWIDSFLSLENSPVKQITAKTIEEERFNVLLTDVNEWLNLLRTNLIEEINPSLLINIDETGFGSRAKEISKEIKVIVPINGPNEMGYSIPREDTHVSALVAIVANGKMLKPTIIHKNKTLSDDAELCTFLPNIYYAHTKSAFINTAIFTNYIIQEIIPYFQKTREKMNNPGARAAIIMDGHYSHNAEELMAACASNNVEIYKMPPHSSHMLQPLDRLFFSRVKYHYRTKPYCYGKCLITKKIEQIFISLYYSSVPNIIISSWRNAGIYPHLEKGNATHVTIEEKMIISLKNMKILDIEEAEKIGDDIENGQNKSKRLKPKTQNWGKMNEEHINLFKQHICPLCKQSLPESQ